MTPNRPYLLRALFDWICDNNCTPYLLVDATLEGVEVPYEHVNGGRIVLNASGSAVANFDISDECVSFNTRFSGRDTWIKVPMAAVLAIYAKETQEGMTFSPSDYPDRKQRPEYLEDAQESARKEAAGKDTGEPSVSRPGSSDVNADAGSRPRDAGRTGDTSPEHSDSESKSPSKPSHLKVVK